MMASQKKTIDVIGSIDDYALEPSIDTPITREDDNTWSSPRIIFGVNEKVLVVFLLTLLALTSDIIILILY